MDDRLTELTVREMIERLATRDPVPGGGSAAALAGAMGAGLLHMVVELTTGQLEAGDTLEALNEIARGAIAWQSELLNLVDLDANAYNVVVRARRLPRITDMERQARDVQVAAAIREATRAPLETMRAATAVFELAERLAPLGNRHAISDVGVGAMLASSSVRGAALNVRINLPYLKDEELRREANATLETLAGLTVRERTLIAVIQGRLA